ncbi:hypothetical protein ACOWPH_22575 [Anabaena sp. PCC 7938]|uniref:Uncharacterized protein n=1 Tax=Anabaena cylindrica (strain ATCC 27899 / PCC 7122) TaxID=272123 RepID=K9Z945_ANACC|nr:hypothetical protein [Anabaena sp. CCAP 1446/1C]AFZ55698.1 hypothetical protein Anacy_0087 [Anabaena cylindrica PCC 7122]MBY5282089.1 hypothetical protein [Anabaena sp. CCAP 1446/1C]MCM2406048.1 hypothetical protein [Anabaena sp. CCAP 1446/1C]BAY01884.1 hypothetical protein NIES19_11200 [Anabaena cylindrica PCC 7122]
MNNWLSTSSPYQSLTPSNNNNLLLPPLPASPVAPITVMPQANPPIIFLPKYS